MILIRVRQSRRSEILNNQVDDVQPNEIHESEVLVSEYAVEYICIEEDEIRPSLTPIHRSLIQHRSAFPTQQYESHPCTLETLIVNTLHHLLYYIDVMYDSHAMVTHKYEYFRVGLWCCCWEMG